MKFILSSLLAALSLSSSLDGALASQETRTTECTVTTIASTRLGARELSDVDDSEYVCAVTGRNTRYRINGDVKAFLGSSYKSSQTTFSFPSSVITDKILNLNDDLIKSSISYSNPPSKRFNRSQRNEGSHKGLIVRVVDSTGDEPEDSANALYGQFYEDDLNSGISVASVFEGCSNSKFTLSPATGTGVTDGVIEVTVGYAVANEYYSDVSDDVFDLLESSLSSIDYTYVMMVFPESVELSSSGGNTIGKGEMPGYNTWYKGGRTSDVTLGVHEVGHNLYLYHSGLDTDGSGEGDDDEEYDDPTCVMGGESPYAGDGRKCFNAAKTYYLGWYSDYHGEVNPTSSSFSGELVGVNDAGNNEISSDQNVVVKISDSGATDLFLMYNRVEGVHNFLRNVYYQDKIVVVEQSEEAEQSWVAAVLDQGDTYSQSNWAGTGNALKIKACYIHDGTPDVAKVGIWLNGVNSVSCDVIPTISPAPTPEYKVAHYAGNPCGESYPETGLCPECSGDCDDDSDCEGDLICFQRYYGNEDVPGCVWGEDNGVALKASDEDFCVRPDATPVAPTVPTPTAPTPTVPTPTAPTPTAPTPTAPTPTSDDCVDFENRIRFDNGSGSKISRSCEWVGNKSTNQRCAYDGVSEACPLTCDTCDSCVDPPSSLRFKFRKDGAMVTRSCTWVERKQTAARCTQTDNICRATCGVC